jgi:hypothetical protein
MLVVMLSMMLRMVLVMTLTMMMLAMPFMTYNCVVRLQLEPMLPCFKLEHPQAWYHQLGLHVHSLVILLKVKITMNDDLGIFDEGIYEGDEVVVLAWFSTLGISHYC